MAGSVHIAARVVHRPLITRTQCRMLTCEKPRIDSGYESLDGDVFSMYDKFHDCCLRVHIKHKYAQAMNSKVR